MKKFDIDIYNYLLNLLQIIKQEKRNPPVMSDIKIETTNTNDLKSIFKSDDFIKENSLINDEINALFNQRKAEHIELKKIAKYKIQYSVLTIPHVKFFIKRFMNFKVFFINKYHCDYKNNYKKDSKIDLTC